MKFTSLFLVWLVILVGIMAVMVFIYNGPDIRSDLPRVYIVLDDSQAVVVTRDDFRTNYGNYQEQGKSIATAVYEPEIHRGPVGGVIELFSTESIFPNSSRIFSWKDDLTESEIARAYEALFLYTNNDPMMVQFHPGKPANTRFVPSLLLTTIIRLLFLISVPTICVYTVSRLFGNQSSKSTVESSA